jgi:hypothetical protein
MNSGEIVDVYQNRTGWTYRVEVIRQLGDEGYVGLTLSDSPLFSAGAQILITPADIVTKVIDNE